MHRPPLTLRLHQMNSTVGNLEDNVQHIRACYERAVEDRCHLVAFPELAITGYPLEDLVLYKGFTQKVDSYLSQLLHMTRDHDTHMLLSTPYHDHDRCYNAIIHIARGEMRAMIPKVHLPHYAVFDEKRVFTPGMLSLPIDVEGHAIGVMSCEDIWFDDVPRHLVENGASLLLVLNASPFELHKQRMRMDVLRQRVRENGRPLLYLNSVGGSDELVFDGHSLAMNHQGEVISRLAFGAEDQMDSVFANQGAAGDGELSIKTPSAPAEGDIGEEEQLYRMIVVALRDYMRKNAMTTTLLGLSGGIDSALVAALAVDALGPTHVYSLYMPSPYSSDHSRSDAEALAKRLGIHHDTLPITPLYDTACRILTPLFQGKAPDLTEENLQARCRALLLMALSNKHGHLLLNTGNKSELAMGYSTLYGDSCGGFAPLKDLYKTQVYRLCAWRNSATHPSFLGPSGEIFSNGLLTKPPSAELRPDQKDSDSLPPYERLDPILRAYIDEGESLDGIAAMGIDRAQAAWVLAQADRAEYKRRQSPPGPRLSHGHLGRDRRYPITNRFQQA